MAVKRDPVPSAVQGRTWPVKHPDHRCQTLTQTLGHSDTRASCLGMMQLQSYLGVGEAAEDARDPAPAPRVSAAPASCPMRGARTHIANRKSQVSSKRATSAARDPRSTVGTSSRPSQERRGPAQKGRPQGPPARRAFIATRPVGRVRIAYSSAR